MFSEQIKEGLGHYSTELKPALLDLSIESNRSTVLDKLNTLASEIEGIKDLAFNIVVKNGVPFLLFKYTASEDEVCKGGIKLDTDNLDNTLISITNAIYNGTEAVKYLNSKLDDIRSRDGIILGIKYRWGYSAHAHVTDWTYDNIVIRLSRSAINKLSAMSQSEMTQYIDKIADGLTWEYNVAEYMSKFSTFKVNSELGLELKYNDISDCLLDNMLTYDDIVSEVKKKLANDSGVQYFKSIAVLNELGKFAAIVSWAVDYKDKDATASIMDDKVIDLENLIFVSDHSLYSRIEQRILSGANDLSTLMKEKAS